MRSLLSKNVRRMMNYEQTGLERWQCDMIGCYVSNELQYNPETRKFEEELDEVPEQLIGEDSREADWWENGFDMIDDLVKKYGTR